MTKEIEVKIRASDLKKLKKKLSKAGACFNGKISQNDRILDFKNGKLKKEGKLLRVREISGKGKKEVLITYKSAREEKGKEIKTREEVQFSTIENAKTVLEFFGKLGLEKKLNFEKITERYSLGKTKITIDSFPQFKKFGHFYEIEAENEKEIRRVMKLLGAEKNEIVKETYAEMIRKEI